MKNEIGDSADRPALEQGIEVTPEMVDAGLDELREHHYADDTRHMLESVYRAMAYASPSASASKASR